jgi:hypothetical protein
VRVAAVLLQQLRDEAGSAGLRPDPGAVVPVKIFMGKWVITPMGIILELAEAAMSTAPAPIAPGARFRR